MAPTDPPSEVTVKVKIPPGHLQGTTEEVFSLGSLSTTHPVSILRQRIQTLVPTNPIPSTQRILYCGRALIDDEQSLGDALNIRRDPAQTDYVVHLLVRNGHVDGTARSDHGHVSHTGNTSTANILPLPDLRALLNPQGMMRPDGQNIPGTPQLSGAAALHGPGAPAVHTSHAPVGSEGNTQPGPTHATNATDAAHGTSLHREHHNHHALPHILPGPSVHSHGQPSPLPRPSSSHGFHISGTAPDGHHFAIHQHTFTSNGPLNGSPLPMMPPGPSPGLPAFMGLPFPGMPQQAPQPSQTPVFSALERARENMAEMSRMLNTLREENVSSEDHRARVVEIEQRMRAVNDYLDPFHLGTRNRGQPPAARTQTPANQHPAPVNPPQATLQQPLPSYTPQAVPSSDFNLGSEMHNRQFILQPPPRVQVADQTSVYLLSSPQGPHALLFSPQYGNFSGSLGPSSSTVQGPFSALPLRPTPTQPAQPDAAVVPRNEQPGLGQVAQAQADPLAIVQPILGHLWLLFRVLIFAYFLMGADMGWRRPIGLFLIGLGFWLIRLGLFGNGGLVRRWWDGVVRVENIGERMRRQGVLDVPQAQNEAPAAADAQAQATNDQVNVAQAAPRPFPTPEELAQRLIREQHQHAPLRRLREQIRPAERALALFIASLWPGVGERYVQALDRAREEEEAARRLIELQREEAARAQESPEQENKESSAAADTGNAAGSESVQQAESSSEKKNE